jgi:hypothetical protein
MKKILVLMLLALIGTASTFALELGDIKGTWQDNNWNADWTFTADGKIVLTDSTTGEVIFTFTDSNIQNFKLNADTNGVSISFDCKDTNRSYKFTKPIALNADLDMYINPEWTDTDYNKTITWKK